MGRPCPVKRKFTDVWENADPLRCSDGTFKIKSNSSSSYTGIEMPEDKG